VGKKNNTKATLDCIYERDLSVFTDQLVALSEEIGTDESVIASTSDKLLLVIAELLLIQAQLDLVRAVRPIMMAKAEAGTLVMPVLVDPDED